MRSPLHKRLRVLVPLFLALFCAAGAWAYWIAPSSGHASGHVGTLAAPVISAATPGTGTVALSWSAVTAPGAGSVEYYVTRDGGQPAGNCPTATTASTPTTCTDAGLEPGNHTYKITALYRSWTSRSLEATADVTVGAVDHLLLSAASTSPTAGASDNLTITAKDSAGTTVTSYSGSKSLTFGGASAIGGKSPAVTNSSGSAVAFGTAETITFTNGVATVSSTKNGAMTLYKAETADITVSDGTVSNGAGVAVTVSPASVNAFAVGTPSSPTAGKSFTETLTALDQYGNTATSYEGSKSLTFRNPTSSPSGKAPAYPSSVSFTAGVATPFSVTLYDAQTTTLSVKEGFNSTPSGTSAGFTVAPAGASSLSVANPGTQTAGSAFADAITAKDEYGNTATSYEGTKTLSFSGPGSAPGGKAPEYPATVSFTAGSGSASITLYDAQSTTLGASDGAISGTSSSFTVNGAATPASFTMATPSSQTAGTSFSVAITAKDAYGNTANYSTRPAAAFGGASSSPGGKAPAYPTSVSFTSGSGSASVTLYDAQTTSLTMTIGALGASTGSFTVAPASAAVFAFAAIGPQTAGTPFEASLTAEDSYGNVATSYTGSKSLIWSGAETSPSNKAPGYPATVSFAAGLASAPVTLYAADSTTTINATQGSVKGSTNTFSVAAAGASALSLANPGERTAGSVFSETLTAIDAYGNTAAGYEGTKAITFSGASASPSGKAPAYPATVTFAGGVGSAAITLYNATATTLGASDGSNSGTSPSFTVAPAAASSFALSTPAPSAGVAFNETITAKDSYGNTATSYSGKQSLTFGGPASSPNGKAPVYPSGQTTFSSGVATPSITLYNAAPSTLTATQGTITGTSASFTVSPGQAASIAVGSIAAQTAGNAFNVTLTAKDAGGNGVEGATAVTFKGPAESPAGQAPSYPASVTFTAGAGSASVTLYDATTAAALTAEAAGVKATSASFAVSPAAATRLAWTNPGSSGSTGAAEGLCLFTCTWSGLGSKHSFITRVSVTDGYGNIVSGLGSGHEVKLEKTVSGASLSASTLALPSSGEATSATATYTSSSSFWTSDTLSAKSSGYTEAVATLKK